MIRNTKKKTMPKEIVARKTRTVRHVDRVRESENEKKVKVWKKRNALIIDRKIIQRTAQRIILKTARRIIQKTDLKIMDEIALEIDEMNDRQNVKEVGIVLQNVIANENHHKQNEMIIACVKNEKYRVNEVRTRIMI